MTCYAVARGRRSGIFATWPEAEAQVSGFKGALHQRCRSREEALAFLIAHETDMGPLLRMEAEQLGLIPPDGEQAGAFYAISRGRQPGIYTRWGGPDGAETQLGKLASARWRPFNRREAALIWLRAEGVVLPPPLAAEADAAVKALPPIPSGKDEQNRWRVAVFVATACERDGSCGGYEAILICGDRRDREGAGFSATQPDRVLLYGWIAALERLRKPSVVTFYGLQASDVLSDAANRQHWTKLSSRSANADLWERLGRAAAPHQITWTILDAHPELFTCERAAQHAAATALPLMTDAGYEALELFPDV